MGLGFRLNLKWGLSLHPRHISSSKTSSLSSSTYASFKIKDINYNMARVTIPMESDTFHGDLIGINTCSSSRILDIQYSETNIQRSVRNLLQEDILTFLTSLQANEISEYRLLLENLVVLEGTFADSDVVSLERDILVQLEKIGALKFLRTSFSEIPKFPSSMKLISEETVKPIVPSTRKVERKTQRERLSRKVNGVCTVEFRSQAIGHKKSRRVNYSSRRSSNSKSGKLKSTRNEAELSRGVKMVANLERIRTMLEEETGHLVSFSSWAASAGVDKKELLENLQFGWCCRDELLRSTRSLVIYLAKNYNGQGIAFKDLIQAGNVGVLQGAERFDCSRGYKFSTYVQYWIKKSLLMLLSRHAREIRIPLTMSKAVSKIQKARKALDKGDGRCPDDQEIAKFTGFSVAKVESASKRLRVVGSINHTIGNGIDAKLWEGTPDPTMITPEETLMKEHMITDMYNRIKDLDARERTVLILRFGLKGHQQKTLEEIGGFYGVSKEWIRRIERKALTKLKVNDEETLQSLRHYLYISL